MTSPEPIRITDVRLLPGCSAGLSEPTALVEISHGPVAPPRGDSAARLATLIGASDLDCPSGFLVDRPAGGADTDGGLGEWIVALTVAAQRLAGDPVARGRVSGARPQRLNLAIPWFDERIFGESLALAVRLLDAGPQPAAAQRLIAAFLQAQDRRPQLPRPAKHELRLARAALDRGVPVAAVPGGLQLGWGAGAERLRAGYTGCTGVLGALAVQSKAKTNQTLVAAGVPVPSGDLVTDADAAEQLAAGIGWPVIVKPANVRTASGAAAGVADPHTLRAAFEAAQRISQVVIVERQIEGDSHRMLVLNGEVLAVCRAGGDDVLDRVHPDNLRLARRVARLIGLDVAGVDFVSTDVSRSWRDIGGAVCEVNPEPGFQSFWAAEPRRPLAEAVIDILFARRSARIPTAAITGGPGRQAAAVTVHRIWRSAEVMAGLYTPQTVRVGDEDIATDELSAGGRARVVLDDPGVQAGVFELSADFIDEAGHPCDRYDVVAVLGAADEGCAAVERAAQAVVLDADDPGYLGMRPLAGAPRHILISGRQSCPPVLEHRRQGGQAVVIEERSGEPWVVLASGSAGTAVAPVSRITVVDTKAALLATATAWAHGLGPAVIAAALER